jgi:hypothetical protein
MDRHERLATGSEGSGDELQFVLDAEPVVADAKEPEEEVIAPESAANVSKGWKKKNKKANKKWQRW